MFSRLITLVLVLLVAPASGRADFTRFSCKGPSGGPVEVVTRDNACVGYRVRAAGKPPRRVDLGFLGSGTLAASRDGRTVIMIQSYLYGRVEAGEVFEFIGAGERKDPVGIYVFRDGRLIATHRVGDLAVRKKLIESSTSHVHWVREAPTVFDDRFTITTTSFRTITFDGKTGRILSQADTADWDRCAVIAIGRLDLPNRRLLKAFSHKTLTVEPEIRFILDKDPGLTHHASTRVCLERRDGDLHFVKTL